MIGMCLTPWHSIALTARHINFQYRFLHRILPTNSFLTEIGINQDPNCSFCRTTAKNLAHLFWHCPNVQTFWPELGLKSLLISTLHLETTRMISFFFLGLKSDTSKFSLQINFCFLLARHYIWGCRTCNRTPQLKMLLKTLQCRYKIEYYNQSYKQEMGPFGPTLQSAEIFSSSVI